MIRQIVFLLIHRSSKLHHMTTRRRPLKRSLVCVFSLFRVFVLFSHIIFKTFFYMWPAFAVDSSKIAFFVFSLVSESIELLCWKLQQCINEFFFVLICWAHRVQCSLDYRALCMPFMQWMMVVVRAMFGLLLPFFSFFFFFFSVSSIVVLSLFTVTTAVKTWLFL